MRQAITGRAAALLAALMLGGCATTQYAEDNDPLESPNRFFYEVNDALDQAVLEPAADFYVAITPDLLRTSVSNFFDNIAYPRVVLNDLLQGKFLLAVEDSGRFLVNSTLGLGGTLDLATGFGLARHQEDFGQTLGVWGAGEGAYLNLPLLGPNSVRDAPALVVDSFTNLLFYAESGIVLPLTLLRIVDERAQLSSAIRVRERSALDPYIFTREAYRQRRLHLIYDGNPPLERFDEPEFEPR